ncbi:hypothetical protein [Silvibacterium dinghuense]|uniref:Uncharacterized protein n=1 Tax=Silvibacterium dinghuense TaxID=1560006 RepID=A0A4Q1SCU6_9BACT|nr:hypothetical protein [Silvibacterium dinghuense]RXS95034.1 hypothetical protein ESZ00_10425 [Silvibacterium dinghuense]
MSGIRRLGDGYEPHVDELADKLTYSLPVDSGFFSTSFSFDIARADLNVLLSDPYRRAALEIIAHTVLQRSLLPGAERVTQPAFDALVSQVLHSTPTLLENYIAEISQDYHIAIRVFIERAMARRSENRTL